MYPLCDYLGTCFTTVYTSILVPISGDILRDIMDIIDNNSRYNSYIMIGWTVSQCM